MNAVAGIGLTGMRFPFLRGVAILSTFSFNVFKIYQLKSGLLVFPTNHFDFLAF
jgi:hypothetical protein